MKRGRVIGAMAVAAAAAGVLGAVLWRRLGPDTYVRADTMFGRARIYQVQDDEGSPVRLLEVGGIVQSGTYVDERYAELVFTYLKGYDVMFEAQRAVRRVCVLGCGGYDYPEHLLAHHENIQVDAVEIDPAITALARRYFFLDRAIEEFDADGARLELICADALDHLRRGGQPYDVIVNDAFDAGRPPAHLTGAEFARAAHGRLTRGGLFLTNIVAPLAGRRSRFLWDQVALLSGEFAHVYVFACDPDSLSEPDNVIVAATDVALPESLAARSL